MHLRGALRTIEYMTETNFSSPVSHWDELDPGPVGLSCCFEMNEDRLLPSRYKVDLETCGMIQRNPEV